jgi:hypothetical protein
MKFAKSVVWSIIIGGALGATSRAEDEGPGKPYFALVRGGMPVATVVVSAGDSPLWDASISAIVATAKRWGGAEPRVVRLGRDAKLPEGNLILLGTSETSEVIAGLSGKVESPLGRVLFGDPQGFAIDALDEGGSKRLVIAGKTPRGAYNGVIYCRDFLLDASPGVVGKANVFTRRASMLRTPRVAARGPYTLPLYGVAMSYTAEDWMKIIDRCAEDGMDRVYFWLSGHHPSKKFPHLYNIDATTGTKLTVEGVRKLIRHCHDRGIRFYIGGGVFAWTAAHYLQNNHPEIAAVQAHGLCPSKPFARTGNREHFLEMYETWSEADGFMFEIRDEHGECRCAECQASLDSFGSKGYGRAEITWLQQFAREVWKKNPKLRFCWLIGYDEHAKDVLYYKQIRDMSDPRFEWLEVRVGLDPKRAWRLPGPDGQPRPLAFFSRQILHFDPYYKIPITHILSAGTRCAEEGLFGYAPAFEPGFATGSYYSDQIPFPTDILPFTLSGFAYREATWEPSLTLDGLKERICQRYFSPDAPKRFADDLIYLRQFSIDHAEVLASFAKPRSWYDGRKLEPFSLKGERERVRTIADPKQRGVETERLKATVAKLAAVPAALDRMKEIESAITASEPAATPKTRDGFTLIRRLINDTRVIYSEAIPDSKLLSSPID